MKMQNVECRMQNEEGTPEIFSNRCPIRSGVQQGSGAKGWRVYESCDSYRSYHANSEHGSGISGISVEKSRPYSRSYDAKGPFCRRNLGKYAPHKICSVIYSEGSELDACGGPKCGNRKRLFGYVRFSEKNVPQRRRANAEFERSRAHGMQGLQEPGNRQAKFGAAQQRRPTPENALPSECSALRPSGSNRVRPRQTQSDQIRPNPS